MSTGPVHPLVEARTSPRPPQTAAIRLATAADVPGAVRLAVAVAGYAGSADDWRGIFERNVSEPDRHLFVAVQDDQVIGYTRLGLVESDAPAPDGYYLVGLIVDAAHRRRGVAEALVTGAIEEAARHADELWSFYDEENGASAALHARLGFVEVTRGAIGFPGLSPESRDVLVRRSLTDGAACRVGNATCS